MFIRLDILTPVLRIRQARKLHALEAITMFLFRLRVFLLFIPFYAKMRYN